ncbi:hypothetical protein T484DRAFT_1944121 [Baffinella frigidus]|nr:hypothetical protein T484DRAFT_1944121 [Cryptophyta sp. CCMP2293]
MSAPNGGGLPGALGGMRGGGVQAQLIGLVDSKELHARLIQALRAISGNKELKLLHRETVFKLPAAAGGTARPGYELRVRLGKSPAPAMSLLCLGGPITFPCGERLLRSEDTKRRLPQPALRKVVEVEVGHTGDEMLKLMGFETDHVFIRSGHQFHCSLHDRCTIMVSEIHKLQTQQQTPKLEVDAAGNVVNDVYLVEVVSVSGDDSVLGMESAVRDVLHLADKLAPFVTLNAPDEHRLSQP